MTETVRIAKPVIGWARIAVGIVPICIIVYAYVEGFSQGRVNPLNYFGYFTNLTGLATGGVLIWAGTLTLKNRSSSLVTVLRAITVTCMIVVAVIYNGIVPGTGTAALWVSAALHIVFPAIVILDWVLIADRARLPWFKLWLVLPYPMLWLTVALVRGATDGWVPYGFLLPQHGVTKLAFTLAALLTALLCAGALTWAGSRIDQIDGFLAARACLAGAENR